MLPGALRVPATSMGRFSSVAILSWVVLQGRPFICSFHSAATAGWYFSCHSPWPVSRSGRPYQRAGPTSLSAGVPGVTAPRGALPNLGFPWGSTQGRLQWPGMLQAGRHHRALKLRRGPPFATPVVTPGMDQRLSYMHFMASRPCSPRNPETLGRRLGDPFRCHGTHSPFAFPCILWSTRRWLPTFLTDMGLSRIVAFWQRF